MSYRTSVFNRLGRRCRSPSGSPPPSHDEVHSHYYDNPDYYYEAHHEYDRTPWPVVNNSTATPSPPPINSKSLSFCTRHYTPENDTSPPPLPPPTRSSKISFASKNHSRPSPSNLIITANGNDRHVSSSSTSYSSPSSSSTQQQNQTYYPPSGTGTPVLDGRPVVWMEDDRGIEIPVLVNSSYYDHPEEPLISLPIDQQSHYSRPLSQGDTYIPHYSRLYQQTHVQQEQQQQEPWLSSKKKNKRQDSKNRANSSSSSSIAKEQPAAKKIRHSASTAVIPSTPPTSLSPIGVEHSDPQQQNINLRNVNNTPPPAAPCTNIFPVTYQQQPVEPMNNYYNQDAESVVSMDTENTNLMLPDWGEDSDNEAKLQAIALAERRRYEEKEELRRQQELQEESRKFVEEQERIQREAEEQEKRRQEELRQARWEAFLRKEQEEEEERRKKQQLEMKERLLREKQQLEEKERVLREKQEHEEKEHLLREAQRRREEAQKHAEERERKRIEELRQHQEAERKRISDMKQAAINRERKEQEERALERKKRREEEDRRRERERRDRENARLKRRRDEEEERRRREDDRRKREEERRKRHEEAERKKKMQETAELLKRQEEATEKARKESQEANDLLTQQQERISSTQVLQTQQNKSNQSLNGKELLQQEAEERKNRFAEWKKREEERKQREQNSEMQQHITHLQMHDTLVREDNPHAVKQEPMSERAPGLVYEEISQQLVQNDNDKVLGNEASLPKPWIPMHPRSAPDETYYYNPETGESTWERPAIEDSKNQQEPKQDEDNGEQPEENVDIAAAPTLSDVGLKQFVEQQQQPIFTETIPKVPMEKTPPIPTNKSSESRDPRIKVMKKLQGDARLDQNNRQTTIADHRSTNTTIKKEGDSNSNRLPSLFMQGKKDTYIPSHHHAHGYPK